LDVGKQALHRGAAAAELRLRRNAHFEMHRMFTPCDNDGANRFPAIPCFRIIAGSRQ
jgi:hypothetical protein